MEYEMSLGKSSKYYPYFQTFPKDLSECSNLWTEETLNYLIGSPIKNDILKRQKQLEENYKIIINHTKSSLKEFLEYNYLVDSRAFAVESQNISMCPMIDMLNHSADPNTNHYQS